MSNKILFYTHGLVDGGGERLWSCLASAFKARGNDVIFVQDFEADENRSNLDSSIPLFTIGRSHWRAVRRLADILRQEKPDIALSAIGGSNTKLMLAKWLARSPIRTVITYHGFCEWRSGLLSFVTYLALPVLSAFADCTVAVSDGLREQLVKRWGARPEKTITILNPVFFPAAAPVPSEAELCGRPDVLLAVGRLVPEKDFPTLLRAFARLERPSARLIILGKGPEEARLKALCKDLGITSRVTLAGYSKEPWRFYSQAKCFVLSSLSEPFGNVVVEAMAYGLPIVATASAGPQEILRHGKFGRIVAAGSDLQLAHAIADTLEYPGDPAQRRRRADDFSFAVRVPAYEELVRSVLGKANAVHASPVSPPGTPTTTTTRPAA
ncbi:MAG: glycosyltransferase [Hyphomicrobium sp.]|nr:glycosyltransferase [Hyphomicrobium sp.]